MSANPKAFPMTEAKNRLVGDLPKIGIRPVIDGRWGGVRESLEEKTMAMAKAAKEAEKPKPVYPSSGNTSPSTAPPSSAGWINPCRYIALTSPFGGRIHPISGVYKMHYGVDLAAPTGRPIYATRSGTIDTAAYQAGGAGYYVSINHGDGFSSVYMHMTHYIVSAGQYVYAGQVIGYCGSTGASTGPHLHFGLSYNGSSQNPAAYINFY